MPEFETNSSEGSAERAATNRQDARDLDREAKSAVGRIDKDHVRDAGEKRMRDDLARAQRMLTSEYPLTPDIDAAIVEAKTLRVDLDGILQRIKLLAPTSRHTSLAITHCEDVILRLGMQLKYLNEMRPRDPEVEKAPRVLAEEAYQRYGAVTDFKNFQGNPMPAFAELPERIQAAWEAVVSPPAPTGANPYPNSYDPTNTKVDPTADNLKM
jgi:hypothetical protein